MEQRTDLEFDFQEVDSNPLLPTTGEEGTLYLLKNTVMDSENIDWASGTIKFWDGSVYQTFLGPHPKHRPQ